MSEKFVNLPPRLAGEKTQAYAVTLGICTGGCKYHAHEQGPHQSIHR